jgi:hypothetical protein
MSMHCHIFGIFESSQFENQKCHVSLCIEALVQLQCNEGLDPDREASMQIETSMYMMY